MSAYADWRKNYDAMREASAPSEAKIAELQMQLGEIQTPYLENMAKIEAQLKPDIHTSFKADGVKVSYRKGSTRVTYTWQVVDAVSSVLKDILPETAKQLEDARSETTGSPSIKFERAHD